MLRRGKYRLRNEFVTRQNVQFILLKPTMSAIGLRDASSAPLIDDSISIVALVRHITEPGRAHCNFEQSHKSRIRSRIHRTMSRRMALALRDHHPEQCRLPIGNRRLSKNWYIAGYSNTVADTQIAQRRPPMEHQERMVRGSADA